MTRLTYQLARMAARLRALAQLDNEAKRGTRVLMFHDLHESASASDLYTMPAQSFRKGIASLAGWMREYQYDFLAFAPDPRPGVALTFDDGYRSTMLIAADVLTAQHIPFHVFVTKSYATSGDSRYLNESDLKRLVTIPGITLGVHGVKHDRMSRMPEGELREDLTVARDWLEQLTGVSISTLSYPHGCYTSNVAAAVENSGYLAAACSSPGTFSSEQQRFVIPRIDMWSQDDSRVWIEKTRGSWDRILP
jgi:peptidoglycan/xylan/chitin deacetylase (PgdA/CDA1 family)